MNDSPCGIFLHCGIWVDQNGAVVGWELHGNAAFCMEPEALGLDRLGIPLQLPSFVDGIAYQASTNITNITTIDLLTRLLAG